MRSGESSLPWFVGGTLAIVALAVLAWHSYTDPTERVVAKAQRAELAAQMRRDLAAASEAEKSAVMAITDEDSQTFAQLARAATAEVERERSTMGALLERGGTLQERELLAQFSKPFAELQRVDTELLDLAVRNTNIKASALAFGPAAEAIRQLDTALSQLLVDSTSSSDAKTKRVMLLAAGVQAAALRIEVLLPQHIAEESDEKMDEIEAAMAKQEEQVRLGLDELAANLPDNAELEAARTSYSRFAELKRQILSLSRENTNIRSLSLSLNQKRKVLALCEEGLAALEKAIEAEPVPGMAHPAIPR